jgi:K+-transporting ATPase ATPase A chain
MGSLQTIIVLILFVLLIIPMGKYVYKVFDFQKTRGDKFLNKIDNFIYKVCDIEKNKKMNWKEYTLSIITISLIMTLVSYILLRIQAFLPLNPSGAKGMEQSLSFNTVISFLTNTNLQDYSGESALSHLSQMIVIIFFMFASAAIGYSTAAAFIRGLRGDKDFGNFFVDMTRTITRILLPLSIVVTILLVAGGVPQTFSGTKTVTTIEGKMQDIARGPVAALESIKHIGTNGGGFFGANSAHPFENPNPITNIIEMLAMMLLPGSLVVAFGHFIRSKKQGWAIFAAMAVLLLMMIPICNHFEAQGNPALSHYAHLSQSMGNMEGKEERFGLQVHHCLQL